MNLSPQRLILFFLLPLLALLLWPPLMLGKALGMAVVALLLCVFMAFFLLRGSGHMLTFAIFVLGMNIIVRMMMYFGNGYSTSGTPDYPYLVTNIAAIALSLWLVLRLDRPDVRKTFR